MGKRVEALAERLKHAGDISSLSPEVRNALKDAAKKLAEMGESQPSSPRDPNDATGAASPEQGDAAQAKKGKFAERIAPPLLSVPVAMPRTPETHA